MCTELSNTIVLQFVKEGDKNNTIVPQFVGSINLLQLCGSYVLNIILEIEIWFMADMYDCE